MKDDDSLHKVLLCLYMYIDDVSSKNKFNHLDALSQYDNCALDNTVLHVTKEQNRTPGSAA